MHLSDAFLELFTFVRYVTDPSGVVDADFETVRSDVVRLIRRLETRARKARIAPEQFDMARFAVFAWIDEAILCSDWVGGRQWLKTPLQREYYGTANAGEEFFQRLDGLLDKAPGGHDGYLLAELARNGDGNGGGEVGELLEVYTLCLSLGFTGMYFNEGGRERLERLRQDCLSRIVGNQGASGLSAFPGAYGSGQVATKKAPYGRVFDPLAILFILLPLLVVAGMFFAYRGLLQYSLDLWFS